MQPSSPLRRFPAPWKAERIPGGWCVNDADGQPLAYVYRREDQGVKNYMLTMDEARRIAANIARLPDLLGAPRVPVLNQQGNDR